MRLVLNIRVEFDHVTDDDWEGTIDDIRDEIMGDRGLLGDIIDDAQWDKHESCVFTLTEARPRNVEDRVVDLD